MTPIWKIGSIFRGSRKDKTMQAQDIEHYLADLGQALAELGQQPPLRLLLVGGAFMLTQLGSRRTTNDIDVVLKDVDDLTASSLSGRLKTAARTVATRNQIPVTWINDVIGDFLRDTSRVPPGTLWRIYGPLEVYVPESAYILALKLLAGRPKDLGDIHDLSSQLHIHTRAQAQTIVDRYIPNKQVQQINNLERTLDSLFP
jgi:hypothetical protein